MHTQLSHIIRANRKFPEVGSGLWSNFKSNQPTENRKDYKRGSRIVGTILAGHNLEFPEF